MVPEAVVLPLATVTAAVAEPPYSAHEPFTCAVETPEVDTCNLAVTVVPLTVTVPATPTPGTSSSPVSVKVRRIAVTLPPYKPESRVKPIDS